MGTKKCYNCLAEADDNAKECPRCESRLGARTRSGVARKPAFPLLKILLVCAAVAAAGKLAVHSRTGVPAAPEKPAAAVAADPRDGAIRAIKEKAASALSTVGVTDIGYKEDVFCVYVDQRFSGLTRSQQEQLLTIVTGEWKKAVGSDSAAVRVVERGTLKTIAELVL